MRVGPVHRPSVGGEGQAVRDADPVRTTVLRPSGSTRYSEPVARAADVGSNIVPTRKRPAGRTGRRSCGCPDPRPRGRSSPATRPTASRGSRDALPARPEPARRRRQRQRTWAARRRTDLVQARLRVEPVDRPAVDVLPVQARLAGTPQRALAESGTCRQEKGRGVDAIHSSTRSPTRSTEIGDAVDVRPSGPSPSGGSALSETSCSRTYQPVYPASSRVDDPRDIHGTLAERGRTGHRSRSHGTGHAPAPSARLRRVDVLEVDVEHLSRCAHARPPPGRRRRDRHARCRDTAPRRAVEESIDLAAVSMAMPQCGCSAVRRPASSRSHRVGRDSPGRSTTRRPTCRPTCRIRRWCDDGPRTSTRDPTRRAVPRPGSRTSGRRRSCLGGREAPALLRRRCSCRICPGTPGARRDRWEEVAVGTGSVALSRSRPSRAGRGRGPSDSPAGDRSTPLVIVRPPPAPGDRSRAIGPPPHPPSTC